VGYTTDETRAVEALLRTKFQQADAYRFNSASIRVRVVDALFQGMTPSQRHALLDPVLAQLPPTTENDILILLLFTPDELAGATRQAELNANFEKSKPIGNAAASVANAPRNV
jgi:hypothetical protein